MAKERVKRKLSVILAADVVGYSRLMGQDEAATLRALKTSTVKDLVAGSGLEFIDQGVHTLKGVPNKWHLYAAR